MTTKRPGRPTKYDPAYHPRHALNYALMGAINDELAAFFDVAVSTIDLWIATHEEFSGAIKEGRAVADATIASRLFKRACGYEVPAEKIFFNKEALDPEDQIVRAPTTTHVAPDPTSMIFWLKNRRPDKWRDRKDHTVDPGPQTQEALEKGKPWAAVYVNGAPYDGPAEE